MDMRLSWLFRSRDLALLDNLMSSFIIISVIERHRAVSSTGSCRFLFGLFGGDDSESCDVWRRMRIRLARQTERGLAKDTVTVPVPTAEHHRVGRSFIRHPLKCVSSKIIETVRIGFEAAHGGRAPDPVYSEERLV